MLPDWAAAIVAEACHEVNRAYCIATGDHTQVEWHKAPDWQRQSAIAGVQFHACNANAGPDASHLSWMAEKAANGWKWGPVKDADKKEHPCFLPYNELPHEQQVKDHLFRAVCHAAIDAVAYTLARACCSAGAETDGLSIRQGGGK